MRRSMVKSARFVTYGLLILNGIWEDDAMADEELKSEIEKLRAENEALKKASSRGLSLRVSEKGAVSVYGLGRFPVTLYKEQWLRLLDMAEEIQGFIRQNEVRLKSKAQSQA